MSLAPGVRLGPYEILAAIGAGGMGEVYRARDTKLERNVAIKVLPDAFAADPERIARFQREAKTLASLNHPHIAAIYGVEHAGAVTGLVLELVAGPTLADRITQGPLPVDEALPIARQITEALEAAHELGIIHRDLKPANIKLRPDGAVKVLDFGLAKALRADASSVSNIALTNSPTITSPIAMSGIGVLLGTAAYMAPEQARGKVVDKRADIWAFGCVFYEMLTGRAPFAGNDVSEVLAGVIKSDPEWEQLPTDLPPALRKVLQQCLHKDPKQRLRDIGDVRLALDGAFETGTREAASAIVRPRRSWQSSALTAVAVALLAATTGFAVWTVTRSRSTEPVRVRRVAININAPTSYNGQGIAISPDGTRVVYSATIDTRFQLYQRSLEQLEAQPLPGTENARQPFFSPDGEWIAFFSDGGGGGTQSKLQKISTRGGLPQPLCAAPFARGGWWSQDGTIIFASGATLLQPSLFRIPSNGGTPEPLEATKTGQLPRGWPQTLSGGKRVLFTTFTGMTSRLEVLSLETGESQVIVENGLYGRYIPTGHLLYMSGARLMAAPFDTDRLETTGPAVVVIEGVRTVAPLGTTSMAIADDGTLVYQPGAVDQQRLQGGNLVVVNREAGRATPVNATRGSDIWPRLSPDESQVAVFTTDITSKNNPNSDVWVYDLRRGTRDRITTDMSEDSYQVWTPDGLRMVFLSTRTGTGDLYWQPLDKSKVAEPLVKGENRKVPNSFSKDGKVLAFYEVNARSLRDIWMLPVGGKPEPFIATPADELGAVFSPDGKWIAYVSDESGERQVYAQPYPGPGRRVPISTGGGEGPVWSRDGRELFYFRPQTRESGQILVVDVKAGPALASVPRVLFEGPFVAQANGNANYDVFRDGRRFIMIQAPKASTAAEAPLVAVLNWFEELKRLAP